MFHISFEINLLTIILLSLWNISDNWLFLLSYKFLICLLVFLLFVNSLFSFEILLLKYWFFALTCLPLNRMGFSLGRTIVTILSTPKSIEAYELKSNSFALVFHWEEPLSQYYQHLSLLRHMN